VGEGSAEPCGDLLLQVSKVALSVYPAPRGEDGCALELAPWESCHG